MAIIWFATLLSIPGLIVMARQRMQVITFLFAVYALYPVMYYVVVSDVRYRYPILWLTLLPAGLFVDVFLKRAPLTWLDHRKHGQSV
jgi:nitrate reductase NapE component